MACEHELSVTHLAFQVRLPLFSVVANDYRIANCRKHPGNNSPSSARKAHNAWRAGA